MPLSATLRTLHALGCFGLVPDPSFGDDCRFQPRLFHGDADWIGELADCLEFRELLRCKFLSSGHINLEAPSY